MILPPNPHYTHDMIPTENPPSYDVAVSDGSDRAVSPAQKGSDKDVKQHQPYPYPASPNAGPSMYAPPAHPPSMPATTVYHYVNPLTGEQIASLLPPDHPEMICLQEGRHIPETHFGLLGILAAIIWFPLGIGLCLLDRKIKCKRCGLWVEEGLCG
ncbi:hypothetical protein JAAARDRAFT_208597 [Jaapia argillacea MUCL 33604]|uniref:Uncharacterized protein n=1 Tax=Jaapia argillacea MUCL 33604 TaxID=933084 RepID=A0A067PLP6_9AGAM|nr:hypothetical protein JAAARDRAFT_208597 [Jaapia argillacea MUCL 33604]